MARAKNWMRGWSLRHGSSQKLIGLMLFAPLLISACGVPAKGNDAGSIANLVADGDILYVLDPKQLDENSEVLRIDPVAGEVVARFQAGYDPAMTLTPDGTRLYVSSAGASIADGVLTAIDTQSATEIATTTFGERWANTLPAYFPTLVASPDGSQIFVLTGKVTGPDVVEPSVAIFDAAQNQFVDSVPLSGCGPAALIPWEARLSLSALCQDAHELRLIDPGSSVASAAAESVVNLPKTDDDRTDENGNPLELWQIAWAGTQKGDYFVVTQNGHVLSVDDQTSEVTTIDLGLSEEDAVPFHQVAISPDGAHVYIGLRPAVGPDRLTGNRIAVVSTSSWEVERTLVSPVLIRSFAVSPSGDVLYAVSMQTKSVVVFDVTSDLPIKVIPDIGSTPTLIEVVNGS